MEFFGRESKGAAGLIWGLPLVLLCGFEAEHVWQRSFHYRNLEGAGKGCFGIWDVFDGIHKFTSGPHKAVQSLL